MTYSCSRCGLHHDEALPCYAESLHPADPLRKPAPQFTDAEIQALISRLGEIVDEDAERAALMLTALLAARKERDERQRIIAFYRDSDNDQRAQGFDELAALDGDR